MVNPERVNKKTPNGGDYSELWYLNKDGIAAKSISEAASVKIIEFTKNGEIVGTTYGTIEK